MVRINCNYAGRIHGIGKGPLVNYPVSETQLDSLKRQGYPIEIVSAAKPVKKFTPKVNIVASAPTIEEKKTQAKTAETEVAKVEVTVDPVNTEAEVKEEPILPPEQSFVEVAEAPAEKPDYYKMSKEELEKLVPETVKRPARYGTPWLIKQIEALGL